MPETPEQVESQVKSLKRAATAVSFFLAGITLGGVVAKIARTRENHASSTPSQH